ncbi:RNA-guided endonuclease InsQ/TnpB family protein [Clostridium tetani]|uniref:RNA-guided endonuclease InsQ/TnpB family protein n=1 Tax=Clostridium tetani TaxID=1513 RepID=UPI0024A7E4A9|nr:transposase [Clostridium tetani]
MIKALNIRLYPTQEQITLMYKHIGCMRFVYNWALARQIDSYKHSGQKLSIAELGKELTVLKNTEGYEWLYEVSNATLKEGIRDLDKAYRNFFKGRGFPKFKSKKKSEPKFYSRYNKIYFKDNLVNLEKIGKVKKLNKKLKRLQRQCSKKYIINKKGECYQKTRNIAKLEKKIKKLHSKLKNIRLNHIHNVTSKMVKAKPYRVVMEDLKVSNMMKNKHLSKAIAEQGFNIFINQIKYKCEMYGIKFIQVPTFYPSSKTCSHCGTIKKELKLSDRTYKCSCGFTCNRDKNASYNLVNYDLV